MTIKRSFRYGAAVVVATCLVAACGSTQRAGTNGGTGTGGGGGDTGKSTASAQVTRGWVNGGDSKGTPQNGGTLNILTNAPTSALDPALAAGTTGYGPAAIYSELVGYNRLKGEYYPVLAKSVTHNEDYSTWTISLRPNVKFSDGTTLDAEAVIFSIKRYANGTGPWDNKTVKAEIASMTAPDPLTVVIKLNGPVSGFESTLAMNTGRIVSPTAVQKEGENFKLHPVGAGPFKVKQFVPGEVLKLEPNPLYWGPKPHLDQVNITSTNSPTTAVQALKSGQVQVIYMNGVRQISDAKSSGYPGYIGLSAGQGLVLNLAKFPTSDLKVRRALAMAINPQQINGRALGGIGVWGSQIFFKGSRWYTPTQGVKYDLSKARQLVDEVKKQHPDWNGDISIEWTASLIDTSVPPTLQAQLEAAGFNVQLNQEPTLNALIQKVFVKKNFDIALAGLGMWADDGAYITFKKNFGTGGDKGFSNTELDGYLAQLNTAPNDDAAKDIWSKVQELVNQQVPYIVTHALPYGSFWTKDVHGIVPTGSFNFLLGSAYLSK